VTDPPWYASNVRGARVTIGHHHIGQVADIVLDEGCEIVVGFEVEARSERRYFLPASLARVGEDGVTAASALHLVDTPEYYLLHGVGLSALQRSAAPAPVDVAVDPATHAVAWFEMAHGTSLRRLPEPAGEGRAMGLT
jgi:hypothetical protein